MKNTVHNFTNKSIEFHKEQQILLLERLRASQEDYNYWHNRYMLTPTPENEQKTLKAFETLSYDMSNLRMHQMQEMEERLNVASILLKRHGVAIPSHRESEEL